MCKIFKKVIMKTKKVVGIKALGTEKVYDLTVKKAHTFFGNGTLLHNCDYVGHVMIKLQSASDTDYCVLEGDRIAQAMIQPVEQYDFEWVSELKDTERGAGGFGSTGR